MKDTASHPPSRQLPLVQILSNASVVIDQISEGISTLEHDVLAMIKHEKIDTAQDLAALQQFDFLLQTTQEVSLLLSRLSNATTAEIFIQADQVIAPIKLANMRMMVGLSQSESPTKGCAQQHKSIQLF